MVSLLLAAFAGVGGLVVLAATYLLLLKWRTPSSVQVQIKKLERDNTGWFIPYGDLIFGRVLGKGSQGTVFEAQWRGTIVAVKSVNMAEADHQAIEEFVQEARIMKRLRHPNISLFMGVSIERPRLCIVSEYAGRGALFDILREDEDQLTWRICLNIALDVARGCAYLHAHKPTIIHRDLKSLNILIDDNWKGKVADFGVTRFQSKSHAMTQCGSPLWMAPEMIRNVVQYDEKIDVYSFAIILWELYTRRVPYQDLDMHPNQLGVLVVKQDLRPEIPENCPEQYAWLMQSCWEAMPMNRPSFDQIVDHLERMVKDDAILSHNPMANQQVLERDEYSTPTMEDYADTDSDGRIDPRDIVLEYRLGKAAEEARLAAAAAEQDRLRKKEKKRSKKKKKKRKKKKKKKYTDKSDYGGAQVQKVHMSDVDEEDFGDDDMEDDADESYVEVWKGKYRGKTVAITKFMFRSAAYDNEEEEEKLLKDIRERMAGLRHPHCALFMGAYVEADHVGYVEEFLEKGKLSDLIADSTVALHWNSMLGLLTDIAQGLAYLHQHQPSAVHGDLRPGYLLLNKALRVKVTRHGLIDFAKPLMPVEPSIWTAPEVLEDATAGTMSSNVYTMGLIMYYVITREMPFGHSDLTDELKERICSGAFPGEKYMLPSLETLVESCCVRNPEQRPTIAHVLDQLCQLRSSGPPKIDLDRTNAKTYCKRKTIKAYRSKDPVCILKRWGTNASGEGCFVCMGGDGDVYTVEKSYFIENYEEVPGRLNEYRKTGTILAMKMDQPFAIRSSSGATESGVAGDYIAGNEQGDQWIVPAEQFEENYVEEKVALEEEKHTPRSRNSRTAPAHKPRPSMLAGRTFSLSSRSHAGPRSLSFAPSSESKLPQSPSNQDHTSHLLQSPVRHFRSVVPTTAGAPSSSPTGPGAIRMNDNYVDTLHAVSPMHQAGPAPRAVQTTTQPKAKTKAKWLGRHS